MFLQGLGIVMLTALNITQVARHRYTAAFAVGVAISYVWWLNSSATRPTGWRFHLAYSLGAGFGTVLGMWLGQIV